MYWTSNSLSAPAHGRAPGPFEHELGMDRRAFGLLQPPALRRPRHVMRPSHCSTALVRGSGVSRMHGASGARTFDMTEREGRQM